MSCASSSNRNQAPSLTKTACTAKTACTLLFFALIISLGRCQRTGFRVRRVQTASQMPLCEDKESEKTWSDFMNSNYRVVRAI